MAELGLPAELLSALPSVGAALGNPGRGAGTELALPSGDDAAADQVATMALASACVVRPLGSADPFAWQTVLAALQRVPALASLPVPCLRQLYELGDAVQFQRGHSVTAAVAGGLAVCLRGSAKWRAACGSAGKARALSTPGVTLGPQAWTADPALFTADPPPADDEVAAAAAGALVVARCGGEWVVTSPSLQAVVITGATLVSVLASDAHLLGCASGGGAAVAAAITSTRDASLLQHLQMSTSLLQQLRDQQRAAARTGGRRAVEEDIHARTTALTLRLLACVASDAGGLDVVARIAQGVGTFLGARAVALLEVHEESRSLVVRVSNRSAVGHRVPSIGACACACAARSARVVWLWLCYCGCGCDYSCGYGDGCACACACASGCACVDALWAWHACPVPTLTVVAPSSVACRFGWACSIQWRAGARG